MIKYLAIDPGVTSGLALLEDDGTVKCNHFEHSGYPSPHKAFLVALYMWGPEHIIYEPFHFRQGQLGAVLDGVEYIGVIKLFCQEAGIPITAITPSDGKAFWNDRKIKHLGLWTPGLKHGMDALRLLLTYRMKYEDGFRAKALQDLKGL